VESTIEERLRSPVSGSYDVIVCGGGPAGFVAATAAARAGARTLLLERYGILGGTATAGLMVEFGAIHDGERLLVGGITREFLDRLVQAGGVIQRDGYRSSMTFDPESMIAACQRMVLESGAEVLLHSLVVGALVEDRRVRGVAVESKSGREFFRGGVIVDATGDGDVAARAGADFRIGRDGDGDLQPVSLEVILGNVDDTRRLRDHRELMPRIEEAAARGRWPIPSRRIFSGKRVRKCGEPDDPRSAFFFMNATNCLGVDGTSARDLTRAEIATRSQVDALVAFLREYAPGFENCYLDRTAVQVGVRETRRIAGDRTLTREDVLAARHFPDGVVPACNSIDVHHVKGEDFRHEFLKSGTHYQVPYGCLLPRRLEGLLVAGRCLSADHRALGSARVMVVCMPMGEACGLAAAMSVERGCTPRELPVGELRRRLRAGGTALDGD
jgi:glycine/D-amino acid oxidase-like deaminating enzyme